MSWHKVFSECGHLFISKAYIEFLVRCNTVLFQLSFSGYAPGYDGFYHEDCSAGPAHAGDTFSGINDLFLGHLNHLLQAKIMNLVPVG